MTDVMQIVILFHFEFNWFGTVLTALSEAFKLQTKILSELDLCCMLAPRTTTKESNS